MSAEIQQALSDSQTEIKEKFQLFSEQFVNLYKQALVEKALEEAEAGDEEEDARQLEAPGDDDMDEDTTPILTGTFTKRGDKMKNWKQRFFVVRPNYRIEYYENEDAFNKGAKPKGFMLLDGYDIVTDPNARKIKEKKEMQELFKLGDDPIEYAKYEEFTLEAYHSARRRWLVKFDDKAQFDEWATIFKKCSKLCKSGTLEDELMIDAYKAAFREQKWICWGSMWHHYGGTEVEQLTELYTNHCVRRNLWRLEFPGPAAAKKMAFNKARAAIQTAAKSVCSVGFKALIGACEAAKAPVEDILSKGIEPIATAKGEVVAKGTEQIGGNLGPVKEKVLLPFAKLICGLVGKLVGKAVEATKPVYQEKTKHYVEQVSKGDDMSRQKRYLISRCYWDSAMYKAVAPMDKGVSLLRKGMRKMPDAVRDGMGDLFDTIIDVLDPFTWVAETKDALRTLSASAGNTYAKELGEDGNTAADQAPDVDASIESKFEHDAALLIHERKVVLAANALNGIIRTLLKEPLATVQDGLDSLIPDPVKELLSPSGIIDSIIDNVVDEIAQEAAKTAEEVEVEEEGEAEGAGAE
eukprot:TRINITY_DN9624_c0_g1_i2.p1 TRINITY_DN9624_c0_g1~~TRINITY_DN9624_c0_g1_i2.p1  ORF type:complete len:579 (+),score=224.21 TRINITY_DN9624_c0_g1_i2:45-1781(+)